MLFIYYVRDVYGIIRVIFFVSSNEFIVKLDNFANTGWYFALINSRIYYYDFQADFSSHFSINFRFNTASSHVFCFKTIIVLSEHLKSFKAISCPFLRCSHLALIGMSVTIGNNWCHSFKQRCWDSSSYVSITHVKNSDACNNFGNLYWECVR
jgi:hypothetical protein